MTFKYPICCRSFTLECAKGCICYTPEGRYLEAERMKYVLPYMTPEAIARYQAAEKERFGMSNKYYDVSLEPPLITKAEHGQKRPPDEAFDLQPQETKDDDVCWACGETYEQHALTREPIPRMPCGGLRSYFQVKQPPLKTVVTLLSRIEALERSNAALLDRVNQLVEFHGIVPIGAAVIKWPEGTTFKDGAAYLGAVEQAHCAFCNNTGIHECCGGEYTDAREAFGFGALPRQGVIAAGPLDAASYPRGSITVVRTPGPGNVCKYVNKIRVYGTDIVITMDEPDASGASYVYTCKADTAGNLYFSSIYFQKGPIGEKGVNGLTEEILLAIVHDRLRGFQNGPLACAKNKEALEHIASALKALFDRTKDRVARGVEGKNEK